MIFSNHHLIIFVIFLYHVTGQSNGKRQEITKMSPSELNRYRESVRRLQESGQWVNLAADHGIPNQFCPHGNLRFLIWHRRQIARIEEMLGIPLPYWDWTRTKTIPSALRSRTYRDDQGVQRPNPLYTGPKIGGGNTVRQPLPDFNPDSLKSQEQMAMASKKFEDFTQTLEGAHNDVHGNIGGDMNSIDYAAFDPVFWIHHNNVDRIWYRWQRRNKFAVYPDEARGEHQDSLGIFMGEDVINDLTGWMPGSKQPNVSDTQLPTMSSTGTVSGTQSTPASPAPASSTKQQPTSSSPAPAPSSQQQQQQQQSNPEFQALADDLVDGHGMMKMNAGNRSQNTNTTLNQAPAYLTALKSVRHALHGLQTPLQIQSDINDDVDLFTSVEQAGYQVQNRSVIRVKGIEAGADPLRIDVYLDGQLLQWIHTFGMGHSNMTYKLDRFLDLSKHPNKCSHSNVKDQVKFRITNQRTGQVDTITTYDLELVNMIF